MIGVAVEAAWIGAHIALYPLGLIEDKLEDATNHGVAHLPPAHRGLIVGDVEAAGTPILIDPEMAKLTSTQIGSHFAGWFSFQPLFARITREQPDLFD